MTYPIPNEEFKSVTVHAQLSQAEQFQKLIESLQDSAKKASEAAAQCREINTKSNSLKIHTKWGDIEVKDALIVALGITATIATAGLACKCINASKFTQFGLSFGGYKNFKGLEIKYQSIKSAASLIKR